MVKSKQSGLPNRKRRKRLALTGGAMVLLALAILLGANLYLARHHRVFVVNGYDRPVTVSVPGVGSVAFSQPGHQVLRVPEGVHTASVTGATNQAIPFTIQSDFLGRFFGRNAFLLNPGGAALVVIEETVYAGQNSGVDPNEAGGYQLDYGQPFMVVPDVDYFFEEFPEQITVDHAASREHRRRLDQVEQDPLLIFYTLVGQAKYGDALSLAEWHLTLHAERTEILSAYLGVAQVAGREKQAEAFLAQGAARRPVQIEWHRMYQESRPDALAELVAEYDTLLAESPGDSAIHYLRGRLSGKCSESIPYYVRAIALDATNGFALYALGMCQAAQGQWEAARQSLGQAVVSQPGMPRFKAALFDARMALQDYEGLEAELRAAVAANPLDYMANVQLVDVLLARGQIESVDLLLRNYEMKSRDLSAPRQIELIPTLKARAYYSAGRFEEVLKLGAQHPDQVNATIRFEALVELARFDDAFKVFPMDDRRLADPIQHLTVSLALRLANQPGPAETWRTNALHKMVHGRAEYRLAHGMLTRATAPTLGEIRDLSLIPSSKAALLAVLAVSFPDQQQVFLDEARAMNVSREFPFHLVQRLAKR